jgi:hypothetical protein
LRLLFSRGRAPQFCLQKSSAARAAGNINNGRNAMAVNGGCC